MLYKIIFPFLLVVIIKTPGQSQTKLLQLLLLSQIAASTALSLSAITSLQRQSSITSSANHLITSIFLGQNLQRRLNDTTSQSKDQVKGGFFLDVVVGQSSAVFQLFPSEDQSLLIRRDTFFVLDLGFDIFDGVGGFNFQGDGFTGKGFDEDLHFFKICLCYL